MKPSKHAQRGLLDIIVLFIRWLFGSNDSEEEDWQGLSIRVMQWGGYMSPFLMGGCYRGLTRVGLSAVGGE